MTNHKPGGTPSARSWWRPSASANIHWTPCVFLLFAQGGTETGTLGRLNVTPYDEQRAPPGALCGLLGIHVDDIVGGGRGSLWQVVVKQLRARFPFRKWREGSGEFTGSILAQLPDGAIIQQQEGYAHSIERTRTRPSASTTALALPSEISEFLSMNQQGNWLATHTRPDLSC